MAVEGKARFAVMKAFWLLEISFSAEKEGRMHGWDTPKSAHPCAGSGGDIHVATRSQPCMRPSFSISTNVIAEKSKRYKTWIMVSLGSRRYTLKEKAASGFRWDRVATWMSPPEPAHGCALFGVSQRKLEAAFSVARSNPNSATSQTTRSVKMKSQAIQ